MLQLDWVGKKKKGEWKPYRVNDELSQSIGPEHPGRLRGYPGYAGQRMVYGNPTRAETSHSECIAKSEVRFLTLTLSLVKQP